MLEFLILFLLIALSIYYFLIQYERFTNYKDKNMSYKDYIQIEKNIMSLFNKKDRSLSLKYYKTVPKNFRWKIHRWSMWDYLPNLDYPYHCRIKTYLGKDKCVPISNKVYCSVGNLYKTKLECTNKKHAI
jgi:hypothetical protein